MEYWKILRKTLGHQKIILPGAVGAIIKNDKILLVFHKGLKKWQIPGGLQNLNESIKETIEREIFEELSIKLKASTLISVYSLGKWDTTFPNGDEIQNLLLFFKMKGDFIFNEIKIQKSEIKEVKFFDLHNIPENTVECCKQKCRDLLEYKGEVIFH
jgi:ADP-ribose pyrophosphatase YjhB (NUDIX family)